MKKRTEGTKCRYVAYDSQTSHFIPVEQLCSSENPVRQCSLQSQSKDDTIDEKNLNDESRVVHVKEHSRLHNLSSFFHLVSRRWAASFNGFCPVYTMIAFSPPSCLRLAAAQDASITTLLRSEGTKPHTGPREIAAHTRRRRGRQGQVNDSRTPFCIVQNT
jgi:hypothetical protein